MDSTSFSNFITDELEEIKKYHTNRGIDPTNQSVMEWIDASSESFRATWFSEHNLP